MAFPIFFGLGWMLIVLAGVAVILRYSIGLRQAPPVPRFRAGLAGHDGGVFIGPPLSNHYNARPIELFVIVAGSMSSLYEIRRRPSKAGADVSPPT